MLYRKSIAIIPARGNSKRIKKKNYKKFNGVPTIGKTIKILKKSKLFDRIIVSTDSKEICKISKNCGAEIPFIRPKSLSDDYALISDVIVHCIKFLIKKKYSFDNVCCVYAPNPFLKISDLKEGLNKIKSKKYSYIFSATRYQFPFFKSFIQTKNKEIKMIFPKNFKKRSQDLKNIYCDAAQFYWANKKTWIRQNNIFNKKSHFVLIPKWRYHDLDTNEDWQRAEIYNKLILKKNGKQQK